MRTEETVGPALAVEGARANVPPRLELAALELLMIAAIAAFGAALLL